MKVAVDARETLDWICKVDGIREERNKRTCCDIAVDDLVAAKPDNKGDGNRGEEFNRRREHTRLLNILHHCIEITLIRVHETVDLIVLTHEGLHNARCREAFLQQCRDLSKTLLNDRARLLDLASEDLHCLSNHWNNDKCQERELPVEVEHENKGANENAALRHEVNEVVHEGRLNRSDIIRNIAHDLARLVTVIVRERHPLEFAEHDLAHIDDNLLSDVGDEIRLPKVKNPAQEEDDNDADADGVQQRHVLVGKHVVDHILDDPRDVEIRSRGEDNAHDREREFIHVRPHIGKQSLVILHSSPSGKCIMCALRARKSSPLRGALHLVRRVWQRLAQGNPSHSHALCRPR